MIIPGGFFKRNSRDSIIFVLGFAEIVTGWMLSFSFIVMGKPHLYIWTIIIFCVLHTIATIAIFFHLKAQLRKGNLDTYKRILGINYQRKPILNNLTKYKWRIGFTVVRAIFDEKDELVEYEIKPYSFFSGSYKKILLL